VLKYALYLERRRAQTRAIDKRAQSAGTLRCEDADCELHYHYHKVESKNVQKSDGGHKNTTSEACVVA